MFPHHSLAGRFWARAKTLNDVRRPLFTVGGHTMANSILSTLFFSSQFSFSLFFLFPPLSPLPLLLLEVGY